MLISLLAISSILFADPITIYVDDSQRFKDREGNEITVDQWNFLNSQKGYAFIKRETANDYLISTVWLGIETDGYYFETMVFKNNQLKLFMRYLNEEDAIKGHEQIKAQYE